MLQGAATPQRREKGAQAEETNTQMADTALTRLSPRLPAAHRPSPPRARPTGSPRRRIAPGHAPIAGAATTSGLRSGGTVRARGHAANAASLALAAPTGGPSPSAKGVDGAGYTRVSLLCRRCCTATTGSPKRPLVITCLPRRRHHRASSPASAYPSGVQPLELHLRTLQGSRRLRALVLEAGGLALSSARYSSMAAAFARKLSARSCVDLTGAPSARSTAILFSSGARFAAPLGRLNRPPTPARPAPTKSRSAQPAARLTPTPAAWDWPAALRMTGTSSLLGPRGRVAAPAVRGQTAAGSSNNSMPCPLQNPPRGRTPGKPTTACVCQTCPWGRKQRAAAPRSLCGPVPPRRPGGRAGAPPPRWTKDCEGPPTPLR